MDREQYSSFPTTLSDLSFTIPDVNSSFYKTLSSLRKTTLSVHNRLDSIIQDSNFVVSVASGYNLPLVANERCGSWYIPPEYRSFRSSACKHFSEHRGEVDETGADKRGPHPESLEVPQSGNCVRGSSYSSSAYFKSTDGHHGQWSFSLRRLNLQILGVLGTFHGAVLVDSTRRGKSLPDALRRTVPIWVAVWNRVLFGSEDIETKNRRAGDQDKHDNNNLGLTAPQPESFARGRFQNHGLDDHEVWQIEKRMPGWIDGLRGLGLDLHDLRRKLKRPIRCIWVVNDGETYLPDGWSEASPSTLHSAHADEQDWNTLVLCSASKRVLGAEMSEDGYVQGAGDDSEGWSHGLTAKLFWEHKDELMTMPESELPAFIKTLVDEGRRKSDLQEALLIKPTTNLFLAASGGSSSVQVPDQYDIVIDCNGAGFLRQGRSLVLGCPLNKLGSRELRKRLASVKDLITSTLRKDKESKILVMDESGRDLSVGVVVVILCLFYTDEGEVYLAGGAGAVDKQFIKRRLAWITATKSDANPSRSTLQAINSFLMERPE